LDKRGAADALSTSLPSARVRSHAVLVAAAVVVDRHALVANPHIVGS